MFKRLFTISLLLALVASFTMAQNGQYLLKPNGEKTKLQSASSMNEAILATKITTLKGDVVSSTFATPSTTQEGLEDSLSYRDVGGAWNTNFGFFGQDLMMMWWEAPADLNLKGIGFTISDDEGAANATVSFRLIKLNWTADEMKAYDAATYMGSYPSEGNGYNNVDALGELATGPWQDSSGLGLLPPWTDNADPSANTWDYDLWSDGGFGWPVTVVANDDNYQWVEIIDLGNGMPTVEKGDVFAIIAQHDGINLDADRIGFYSDETIGYPGWKFYQNGRSDAAVDPGWWLRLYAWDMAVAVEITSDLAPDISDLTQLGTTLSTDERTVEATITDINPGGGDAGVASASLVYMLDGGAEVVVPMTASGDVYSAIIPGQSPGTVVDYYVMATDVLGNEAVSLQAYTYKIFLVTDDNNLLVFNGQGAPADLPGMTYPQSYYWGNDVSYTADWTYDAWAFGPLSKELVDNYKNIFEICTNGPLAYNREVIAEWLAADGTRDYLLAGDEWLGADNGYTDQDYAAGTFEYDILGVAHSYNDVSYDGTSGQELVSKFMPVEGTQIGGAMFAAAAAFVSDSTAIDSILYDPIGEIGAASNWHDGFDAVDGAEVFMMGETRGILGAPAVQDVNTGVSNVTANGNKVVFMTYDPISINSIPDYFWLGRGEQSNTYQAMEWFESILIGVDEQGIAPEAYTLSQNYPNPFNPTTVISYSIPSKSDVTLKVFNLLGQEVATLVNGVQTMGSHEVNFNAHNLSSGVYFYSIKAGSFTSTRKMMLIK